MAALSAPLCGKARLPPCPDPCWGQTIDLMTSLNLPYKFSCATNIAVSIVCAFACDSLRPPARCLCDALASALLVDDQAAPLTLCAISLQVHVVRLRSCAVRVDVDADHSGESALHRLHSQRAARGYARAAAAEGIDEAQLKSWAMFGAGRAGC